MVLSAVALRGTVIKRKKETQHLTKLQVLSVEEEQSHTIVKNCWAKSRGKKAVHRIKRATMG